MKDNGHCRMPFGEADTRAKLIDPAIHKRGWTEDLIRREETAGAIEIIDGRPRKRARGRTDYVLRVRINPDTQPIAVGVLEAKPEDLPPTHGLEQAKIYAACKRLNVPFAFSSNGHLFVEFSRITGKTTDPKPLAEFPTPEELRLCYEESAGFRLEEPAAKPLLMRYPGGEATRRYYQDAAIRAALEKIARCEKTSQPKRALLSLATGSGKTLIAVHVLKKIADAGKLRRALFICDRDELRNQGLNAFQNVFGADAAEVYQDANGKNHARNARVHIATYQTLDVASEEGTANFLTTHYPPDYFSHIIIDECHRSAWGKWSEVLRRNPNAVQIGLTATPRQLKVTEQSNAAQADAEINADNLKHFGDPVYEYELGQGIEDGYLAACEIHQFDLFHDNKEVNERLRGVKRQDLVGKRMTDALTGELLGAGMAKDDYDPGQIERRLVMPDRVKAMTAHLFERLLETGGPEQKTIAFCANQDHAEKIAEQLGNLYADWCAQHQRPRLEAYAFRCTASVGGASYIADLRGGTRHHFIATTVDLLSTGVDVPIVRNIIFFRYIQSPLLLHQMIGRGTRLDPSSGKLMFRVYDYTDATRLFGEPFITKPPGSGGDGPKPPPEPSLQVEGFEIHITEAGRYIVTQVDGRTAPVTVEEYKERLAQTLVEEAPTLEQFRAQWIVPQKRQTLLSRLPDGGRSARVIREVEGMADYDLYDVLGDLGYGLAPKRRAERAEAFTYKHTRWLSDLPAPASATLKALASQFGRVGTDGLESPQVFQLPEVARAGGLPALKALGKPADILLETKERIFAV
ncbi:MAG: DEAD/DEAH box helicase family protein [Candidatus Omnitrophica bacterium]|nr:DEAD/DEAH box helicase family protein [Candidatus Omnitrophota bacterium]